jgi:hypothetical protein
MSVLILTDETRAQVGEVVAFAEAHRFTLHDIMQRAETGLPVGDDPLFTCIIPFGYRCCYSLEEQNFGLCRHLSVSVAEENKGPHPTALNEILKLFGFIGTLEQMDAIYLEGKKPHQAVNLIQRYDVC